MSRSQRPDDGGPTDEELVDAALAGERSALDRLLTRHEGRVLRVLRLLGVPPADREDVAQEVFLRVFRHLKSFRRGNAFQGWLYRIAVNATHDYRHRMQRRQRDEVGWSEAQEDPADAAPGPEHLAAQRDRMRQLESALETLTPRERAVFVLCELEGLESRRAARVLGITAITVRRHLGRARQRLQDALAESKKKSPDVEHPGPGGSSPLYRQRKRP